MEKVGARRQHDRDRLPGLKAPLPQPGGNSRSAVVELAESDRAQLVVFFVKLNVHAAGFAPPAQPQNFGKRPSLADLIFEFGAMRGRAETDAGVVDAARSSVGGLTGAGFADDGVNQVLNRIRFGEHPVGQAHAEQIPQSQHQLDTFEATKAEFEFEMRRWASHGQLLEPSRTAQLRQQLAHRRKRLRFNRGRAADFGSCCAHLCTYGANKPSAERFRYGGLCATSFCEPNTA